MRPSRAAMAPSRCSRCPRASPTSSALCSPKRPRSAWRSWGSFLRSLPLASSARTLGSRSPATKASSIARPETPRTSVATETLLDAGVLQGLLDPLALGAVGLDEPLAVAGQIPQLADRRRRHEAAAQQPTLQQLTQPGGITDIGLAAGQDLDVAGVDQQQLEPALFQHIPDRLPVLAGGLHHHLGDALGLQPVRQGLQAGGERRVSADLLAATPATPTDTSSIRDADAGHHLLLADIQRRGPFHDQLHRLPPPTGSPVLVAPGRANRGNDAETRARSKQLLVPGRPPHQSQTRARTHQ